MPKFRKKPIVIEAIQWTGENFDALYGWGCPDGRLQNARIVLEGAGENPELLSIETLEGNMTASVGDWIIKGIRGEIYPCKPDIFRDSYEPVADENLSICVCGNSFVRNNRGGIKQEFCSARCQSRIYMRSRRALIKQAQA